MSVLRMLQMFIAVQVLQEIASQESCDTSVGDTIRLVDGPIDSAGRVEYCINNQWRTICDEEWRDSEARVVCTQLGFSSEDAVAVIDSQFGQGEGDILPASFQCIGDENLFSDCVMNEEERSCTDAAGVVCFPECSPNDIRLIDGPTGLPAGRVEVCVAFIYQTVCDLGWDASDAEVVCRQLGFPTEGAIAVLNAGFGQGTGDVLQFMFDCNGDEDDLQTSCAGSQPPSTCTHVDDAGVICCVEACANGDVRLVGGTSNLDGRVEVCIKGVWSTICSQGWDSNDAVVVCNQLGLVTTDPAAVTDGLFGPGSGPIVLSNVQCEDTESNLLSCQADPLGMNECDHSQDAGVVCPPIVCDAGYALDGDTCVDVNECCTGEHNCNVNAECTNTDGGFECNCNEGYVGNGVQCTKRECRAGYTLSGDRCIDINECCTGEHICHANAECTNTDGGYNCNCREGYAGNGVQCTEIDVNNCNSETSKSSKYSQTPKSTQPDRGLPTVASCVPDRTTKHRRKRP